MNGKWIQTSAQPGVRRERIRIPIETLHLVNGSSLTVAMDTADETADEYAGWTWYMLTDARFYAPGDGNIPAMAPTPRNGWGKYVRWADEAQD